MSLCPEYDETVRKLFVLKFLVAHEPQVGDGCALDETLPVRVQQRHSGTNERCLPDRSV